MKTSLSSLLLTKSWPSLFCTVALAATTFLSAAGIPAQAQTLITGFEAPEDFTAGQSIGGKAGWTGGSTNYLADDTLAHTGTQSLRVVRGNAARLDSPLLHEEGFTGVSLWISNPESTYTGSATFSRFRIVLGDENGSQRILQFQLRYYSNSSTPLYGLDYYEWADGASSSKSTYFSQDYFDIDQWNEFRFETNPDTLTYSVWIGGNEIVSNIAIGGPVTSESTIYQLQFWGHSSGQGGDAYYDTINGITAIPEPSSLAFLGGGALIGLVMLARRRKLAA